MTHHSGLCVLAVAGMLGIMVAAAPELNRLRALVIEHRLVLVEAWNAHFGR